MYVFIYDESNHVLSQVWAETSQNPNLMETSEGQANSAGDCGEMAGFDESMLGLNDVTGSVFGSPEDFILAESEMKVSNEVAPRFYDDWKAIFPQLTILLDNIQVIQEEIANVGRWVSEIQDHRYDKVFVNTPRFNFIFTLRSHGQRNILL